MIWTPDSDRLWFHWNDSLILPQQQKRLKDSFSNNCRPHYLSKRTSTATFSENGKTFECSLESNFCNCDEHTNEIYASNKVVPCKYMYRLARELGLTNESGVKLLQQTTHEFSEDECCSAFIQLVPIIEKYDEDSQFLLLSKCKRGFARERLSNEYRILIVDQTMFTPFIHDGLFTLVDEPLKLFGSQREVVRKMDGASFAFPNNLERTKKGTIKVRAKYDWCLRHPNVVAQIAYPDVVTVQPSTLLQKGGELLLLYLCRKFFDTILEISGGNRFQIPYGAKISDYESQTFTFPDDIVTEQLNLYGHDRCTKYSEAREIHGHALMFSFSFSPHNSESEAFVERKK